jgi:hypothetical protein
MSEKKPTVTGMKERREVPPQLRERVKEYAGARKAIRGVLREGPSTISEVAEATGMQPDRVTFYLMTLMKFGEIEAVDDDDVDEYYRYKLKE